MNILLLANEYPFVEDKNPDRTKVVGYFAKEWVKQGHHVIAIVNSSAFPAFYYWIGEKTISVITKICNISRSVDRLWTRPFSYEENGVYVENLPMRKLIPHSSFSKRVISKQVSEIEKVLNRKDFRPQIIIGHWMNPQMRLIPSLAQKYGAKSALVFHADCQCALRQSGKVQKYIDQIDHIGFRSKYAAEQAKQFLAFRKEPFVAASGIPDAFIQEFDSLPERQRKGSFLRIITAARLLEYKKIDVIIDATAKTFSCDEYDLTIVGEGPLKSKLENRIRENKCETSAHLIGKVERIDLQKIMRQNDVFVLISIRETFGLVYLEAMLHGCIVIASRYGGVDGIIEDGKNGFLCAEGNEEELVTILKRIANMPEKEKEEIRTNAHLTAKQYSETNVAINYLKSVME